MIVQFLTIAAGLGAAAGLAGVVIAASIRSPERSRRALLIGQVCLVLAGVLLMVTFFTAGDGTSLAGGLMLILCGTGVTAVGRKTR